jgi:anti-anti-sigma factor
MATRLGRRLVIERSGADRSEVIACTGWVDVDTCDALKAEIDRAIDRRVEHLRIDLRNVEEIDSAGVRCLIDASHRCQSRGAVLELTASPRVRRMLRADPRAHRFETMLR